MSARHDKNVGELSMDELNNVAGGDAGPTAAASAPAPSSTLTAAPPPPSRAVSTKGISGS